MKKVLFIFLLILFIPVIKAENILEYELDWETKPIDAELAYNHIYKDGYIFEDYSYYDEFFLSYYSSKGKLIKSITIEDDVITGILIEDYIYVCIERYDLDANTFKIIVRAYNDKLELVREIETIKLASNSPIQVPSGSNRIEMIKEAHNTNAAAEGVGVIKDGYFYTLAIKNNTALNTDQLGFEYLELRKYTKDLSSYTVVPAENIEELRDLFNGQIINDEDIRERLNIPNSESLETFTIKGNDIATFSWSYDENYHQVPFLKLFRNNNLLWSKEIGRDFAYEVKFVDNHLMTFDISARDEQVSFNIYDLETGKPEFNRNEDESVFGLMDTKRGFIYNVSRCHNQLPSFESNTPGNKISPILLARADCMTVRKAYSVFKQVETKITAGKGTISVDTKYAPDDKVVFTVTPDEGYVLSMVKVTDATGKTVVFKQNTFTMPYADVLIEAEFIEVTNPETKDIAIILLLVLAILAASIAVVNSKRLKEIL